MTLVPTYGFSSQKAFPASHPSQQHPGNSPVILHGAIGRSKGLIEEVSRHLPQRRKRTSAPHSCALPGGGGPAEDQTLGFAQRVWETLLHGVTQWDTGDR